jgi:hypothetical protein
MENELTLLDNINQSNLLSEVDINNLEKLSVELQETFVKTQIHRTRTEMEISVLNTTKFPTPSLKYWQAMREQNVMFTELVMLSYEYRKNQIEIKMLERDIAKEQGDLERELLQIEFEKKIFIGKQQERIAKARIREIEDWSDIKEREAKQMSEEELSEVDNSQLIGYTKRWIKQSIMMGGNGSPAERQNLLGQLRSGILACIDKEILPKVLEGFDPLIQKQIKEGYGL